MDYYVTFEIAKKLKEKGFKQDFNVFGYKLIYSDESTIKFINDIGAYENEYFGINIPCPSISQVLKWLREDKHIHICISYSDNINAMWEYEIILLEGALYQNADSAYISYEQAALAGIEYTLDNLI